MQSLGPKWHDMTLNQWMHVSSWKVILLTIEEHKENLFTSPSHLPNKSKYARILNHYVLKFTRVHHWGLLENLISDVHQANILYIQSVTKQTKLLVKYVDVDNKRRINIHIGLHQTWIIRCKISITSIFIPKP